MKHLVTGGSGFLGNLIARRLAARGEEVAVFDLWQDTTQPRIIRFIQGNVCVRENLAAAMRGIDIVHHNAALVPLSKAGRRFWEVNVNGSRITAEEAAKAGVKGFIHMSSSAIFGYPTKLPITEQTPAKPVEIYGRAKWAGECAVREIAQKAGMPLIVIRPRTILGEGRLGIFQILFERIRQGRNVYVMGDGHNQFQFVHALDLIDAYLLALDSGKPGIYNAGTDRFGTLRECLENLIRFAGTKSRVKTLPVGLTIGALTVFDWLGVNPLSGWHYLTYHKNYYFDVSRLLTLGWKPEYSNDEMLRESYAWYLKNRTNPSHRFRAPHRSMVREKILSLFR